MDKRELREYAFHGRHSSGRMADGIVEATTLAEALVILQKAGWTEVEMLEDDTASAIKKLMKRPDLNLDPDNAETGERENPRIVEPDPDPDEMADNMASAFLNAMKQFEKLTGMSTDKLAHAFTGSDDDDDNDEDNDGDDADDDDDDDNDAAYHQGAWDALCLPLYDKILEARGLAQWPRAFRLAQAMETIQQEVGLSGIPEMELSFVQASALANAGQLDEALQRVQPFATHPDIEPWMYWGRLSSVYAHALDYENELLCKRRAIEHNLESGSSYIDLAVSLVHHHEAIDESRQALAIAEKKGLPIVGKPYISWAKGGQALLTGNNDEALHQFEEAIALSEAHMDNGLQKGLIDTLRAYRGIALARLGHVDTSRAELADLREFLQRAAEHALLKKWEQAVGEE